MRFIKDPIWQALCLLASVVLILLFLREVYRFRLLRSKFGHGTAILALMLVFVWIIIFIAMVFTSGLLTSIFTYGILMCISGLLLSLIRRNRNILLHPEFLAQADYEKAMYKSIIEKVTSISDVQQMLKEYDKKEDFLTSFMERIVASGNSKVLRKLKNTSHVEHILEIYKRTDQTDNDKFIAASNYLEYGKREP